MLVLGLLLCLGGIWLVSTVIGIIFGVPMIIAGFVLVWLGITFCGSGHAFKIRSSCKASNSNDNGSVDSSETET